jgi:multicomponent K+:H+ antiporter subunit D
MMSDGHWILAPILLPFALASALIVLGPRRPELARGLSMTGLVLLVALALQLVSKASNGGIEVYLLGNWAAPFGIVLALDRLSAMMLALTSLIALASVMYASASEERRGPHFHALMQFQVMGLNGAFLTADLFNLFVFFELLLIASYGLLVHGAKERQLRAAMHYVAFNLTASALFLVGIGVIYAVTGTLNLAALGLHIQELSGADATLAKSAALVLFVVFGVKAAMLPLYFWLPETYGSASASVGALFAILTKVGLYSILRVFTLFYPERGGGADDPVYPWLAVAALGTLALGAAGALAATHMRTLASYVVVASAGTLLLGVGLATPATVGAVLFYLPHSTLVIAALVLVVDQVAMRRGEASDRIDRGSWTGGRTTWGAVFALVAIAASGFPPFGGFLGKAMLLGAGLDTGLTVSVWSVVLVSSLAMIVAIVRAGIKLVWASDDAEVYARQPTVATPSQRGAIGLVLVCTAACAVLAGPLASYTHDAAEQLFERTQYIEAVLGQSPQEPLWRLREGLSK